MHDRGQGSLCCGFLVKPLKFQLPKFEQDRTNWSRPRHLILAKVRRMTTRAAGSTEGGNQIFRA